jgi:hypothetical protein
MAVEPIPTTAKNRGLLYFLLVPCYYTSPALFPHIRIHFSIYLLISTTEENRVEKT